MEVVQDKPVLGIGYANWLVYCNYKHPYGIGTIARCHVPHNTYVSVASETGVFGFFIYVLMIVFVFVKNARTRANAKQYGNKFILYVAHGLDAGLVGYVISSIFFTVLFYPFFWVQLAITVALHEISKKQLDLSA